MIRHIARVALIALFLAGLARAAAASQKEPVRATFGAYEIEANHFEYILNGPVEFSKDVKLTAPDFTLACDQLKVWPGPTSREFDRVEGRGSIVIRARYTEPDKTVWQITGEAKSAAYDRKAGQAVLEGAVSFEATNTVTGAVLIVAADKLVYDIKTRLIRSEQTRGPVRVVWDTPEPDEEEPGGGSQETAASESTQ